MALKDGIRFNGNPTNEKTPLVLLHGGGPTIESTFGRVLPQLAKSRQVTAIESQAHGHTKDIDRPLTFEQDADDVGALLNELHIERADLMGFSNGGITCLQSAFLHPQLVNKVVLASAPDKRDGMQPGFFEGLQDASLANMPGPPKESFLQANPDPEALQAMFDRDRARMLAFTDFSDSDIHAIRRPSSSLMAIQMSCAPSTHWHYRACCHMRNWRFCPVGHGDYIGEICSRDKSSEIPALVTAMIEAFLNAPMPQAK